MKMKINYPSMYAKCPMKIVDSVYYCAQEVGTPISSNGQTCG